MTIPQPFPSPISSPEAEKPLLRSTDSGYVLWIPGTPVPQPRHRTFRRGAIAVEVSRPIGSRAHRWDAQICWSLARLGSSRCASAALALREGPLAVKMIFSLPPLKGLKTRVWHWSLGDVDNYAKLVLDVLTKQGMLGGQDDKMVVQLEVMKTRDPRGCGVRVDVRRADGEVPDPLDGLVT